MKTVHLFVFDTLSDWEPGFAIAGINNPQFQREPGRYQVRIVSIAGKPVTTAGGVKIQPDAALESIDVHSSAMLILPGGALWDQGGNMEAVQEAQRHLNAGVRVAAICGATAGLARGGLLDARKHTSNAREYLAASGYRGAHLYQDSPAVDDDNVITASAMSSLEFARAIFLALDLYEPDVLDAWYNLFSTGKPEYFSDLMAAAGNGASSESRSQSS